MDTTETTHISLCSGYGGIDLGLRRVVPNLRTVAYAEIEAFACENLLARMEGGQLDAAPIWSNLKSFPWQQFSGLVDILSGGYPCQPFSAAGKRAGADDPRHLWPFISTGIALMRPRLCFFENVEGHISLGLPDVIEDLGRLGYRTTWGIFSAAEVGAPHQRKRVFILAYRSGERLERHISELAHQTRWQEQVRPTAGCSRSGGERGVANTMRDGGREGWIIQQRANGAEFVSNGKSWGAWPSRPGDHQHAWEPPRVIVGRMADPDSSEQGAKQRNNVEVPQVSSREWADNRAALLGREGEYREAEPQHWWEPLRVVRKTQPAMGGDADGPTSGMDYAELCVSCDNRTDELRLLGNGVVPAVAAKAFRVLLDELSTVKPE